MEELEGVVQEDGSVQFLGMKLSLPGESQELAGEHACPAATLLDVPQQGEERRGVHQLPVEGFYAHLDGLQ